MKTIPVALITLLTIFACPPYSAAAAAVKSSVAASDHAEGGIAWYQGEVDAAFAQARKSNKPVFLYWGAEWCPPCNQVKATIFNRQGFIERSRFFVPVHIDGDSPSGQKLGARFKVRGYPTMILFRPDGIEITRLPGEVDSERYLQVLTLGMSAGHSAKDTLKAALAGTGTLSADDWRLLSFYSWDTDEQELVTSKDLPSTLLRLAKACPPGDSATRISLSALTAAATAKPADVPAIDKAAALKQTIKLLADTRVARDNMDLLTNYAAELVGFISAPKSRARLRLTAAWTTALQRLARDMSLSRTDRLAALDAQVSLARLDTPQGSPAAPIDAALLKQVRQRVAQADRETTDIYERQSVISTAAHALSDAGLLDESDAMLKAELTRSHSPYYFMLSLAANAKQRGDKALALDWYEQAYNAAKGPATRLQWGATYVGGLIELAPQDEARIEKAMHGLLLEFGATQNAFYERNGAALERLVRKLGAWNNAGHGHESAFKRISAELDGICAKLPSDDPQRAICRKVLSAVRSS